MQEFPHHYTVQGLSYGRRRGVALSSKGLPGLDTDLPENFGGSGNDWSPETLLVAAVADCFSLAFRIVSKDLEWSELRCEVEGELDRIDRRTRFTTFRIEAHLTIPSESDRDRAKQLLEKAEHICVITNSVNGDVLLQTHVDVS